MAERLIINGKGEEEEVRPGFFSREDFPDRKIVAPDIHEQTLHNLIETQRIRRERDPSQNEATTEIKTNKKWVGVFNTGDWHLGSERTDYEKWNRDMGIVKKTDGMYMTILGDERDNFVIPKFQRGADEHLVTPQQQVEMVEHVLGGLDNNGKVLARTGGNHDNWTWEQSGIRIEDFWYRKMKSPLFSNGGFLHLKLQNIASKLKSSYDFYLHHGKSIFNSTFNPNHATKRAYEFQGRYDVGAMGHSHVAEIAHGYRNADSQQHDYVQMRTGTYKIDDQHARSLQLGRGQPAGTTVLLSTEERRMLPFLHLEDAADVLEALNKKD